MTKMFEKLDLVTMPHEVKSHLYDMLLFLVKNKVAYFTSETHEGVLRGVSFAYLLSYCEGVAIDNDLDVEILSLIPPLTGGDFVGIMINWRGKNILAHSRIQYAIGKEPDISLPVFSLI